MTTRAELMADLDSWLTRSDLTSSADADTMLRIAQATINRRVRVRDQEKTTQLTATSRTTALPSDFLSLRSLSLDSALDRNVEFLTPERIREAPIWNNQGGGLTDNTALAFSIEGLNIVLAPAPTATAPVTLDIVYFSKFADLVNDTDTNWLLTNAYDVYLWAILMAAGVYLEDENLEAKFENRMEKAMEELRVSERRARFNGAALISTGSPRRIV